MHVICPHCNNPIELVAEPAPDGVVCSSCGSSITVERGPTTDWRPSDGRGRIGRFVLLDTLGIGAFGTVYKARDPELDRLVAIKVPRAGNLASKQDLDRFVREARSAAQLHHPSIVPVHEVGEQDGVPYIVSDLVHGVTLADLLSARRLSPAESARLIAALADALQFAHDKKVIHRDVKPSNVMIGNDGSPYLMDFGLAKREAGEITMTLEGHVLGTPAYMSPEQARGEAHRVDGRSDVYSLGVILFQLLTGELPFKGTSRMLLHQVLHDEPKAPRRIQKSIPRDLETICLKAMAKDPAGRYRTAAELAADLRRFLNGEAIQARPASTWEKSRRWARRRPLVAAGLALAILLAAGGTAGAFWYWDAHHRTKIEYYAHVVKRRGVPEGIWRVSEEESRRRHRTWRFYRKAGRVERVDYINGCGELTAEDTGIGYFDQMDAFGGSRACRYEYRRDERGQMSEEVAYDRGGQVIWIFHYMTSDTGQYMDRRGFPVARAGSGAGYLHFTWSPEGFEKEVHYLDRNRQRRPDASGVYGVRSELDSRGLVVESTCLDARDQPTIRGRGGYARVVYRRDEMGNSIDQAYFDVHGKPITAGQTYHRARATFDEHGNEIEYTKFGIDDKPCLDMYAFAGSWMNYNERGNRVEWRCFGTNRKPCLARYGAARITWAFDRRGNQIEERFFGLDGNPVLVGNRCRITWAYDAHGRELEKASFGLDGKPALGFGGFARVNYTRDAQGRIIATAYFGVDGLPLLTPEGYAKTTQTYDDQDNPIEWACFGTDGQPILDKDGRARVRQTFNERGNRLEWRCFGVDDKPAVDNRGIHKEVATYDEDGRMTASACFAADGQPAPDANGVARTTYAHDERGNQVEVRYLGLDGKLTRHRTRGYARAIATFDHLNTQVDMRYEDAAGKPVRTRVHVIRVDVPSEANQKGLKAGDVLNRLGGKEVVHEVQFTRAHGDAVRTGRAPELLVLRASKPVLLPFIVYFFKGVELEDRADPAPIPPKPAAPARAAPGG